ncbi:protein takeout-like [Chrysoperla carnea]|uniref:protein takeout-like n=1 Tax=Chrysoperla carnea TaxID=189513 RepID=UPI001D092033|nr:protein takeout-like [Chrysoperla carnea]
MNFVIDKSCLFSVIFFIVVVNVCKSREIPEFLHICKNTGDAAQEECIGQSAMFLRTYLAKGIPEYNLPSLEPLYMDELIASENSAGLKITANKVKAYGASDFYVSKVKVNNEKQTYVGDVDLPHLYIEADYGLDGRILLIPIRGSGPLFGNLTNCKGRVSVQGELYELDGVTKIRFTSLNLKIKVGNGNIKLENLFGGEKVLGDVVNGAINSNFDAFLKELLPVIEKALSKVFLDIANNVVEPFTYDQLFPK